MFGVPKWSASAVLAVLAGFGFSTVAWAVPYWIAWEGNALPEDQGWTRYYGYGGAVRTLQDGILTIDGTSSTNVWDFVEMEFQDSIDPGPGETFVAQWRLQMHSVTGWAWDASVGFVADDSWCVGFQFGMSSIRGGYETGVYIPYAPGVMHEFELHSNDMRTYRFYMDGQLVRNGAFVRLVGPARAGWGDGVQGSASRSSWDYFRFGVVPEPSGLVALFCCCALSARRVQR